MATQGQADLAIMSTEEGFSPLGGLRNFLTDNLGVSYDKEIRSIAQWNRDKNEEVSLIAFRQKNQNSLLRGIILAPGENCSSYKPYSSFSSNYRHLGKPNRDYYYSVSYEAIAYACLQLEAKFLAISHLSSCGRFHQDMATCQVEALINFCLNHPNAAPHSFTYFGCCINKAHLQGARLLASGARYSTHRPLKSNYSQLNQSQKITINW
jgi:hypothetical protein